MNVWNRFKGIVADIEKKIDQDFALQTEELQDAPEKKEDVHEDPRTPESITSSNREEVLQQLENSENEIEELKKKLKEIEESISEIEPTGMDFIKEFENRRDKIADKIKSIDQHAAKTQLEVDDLLKRQPKVKEVDEYNNALSQKADEMMKVADSMLDKFQMLNSTKESIIEKIEKTKKMSSLLQTQIAEASKPDNSKYAIKDRINELKTNAEQLKRRLEELTVEQLEIKQKTVEIDKLIKEKCDEKAQLEEKIRMERIKNDNYEDEMRNARNEELRRLFNSEYQRLEQECESLNNKKDDLIKFRSNAAANHLQRRREIEVLINSAEIQSKELELREKESKGSSERLISQLRAQIDTLKTLCDVNNQAQNEYFTNLHKEIMEIEKKRNSISEENDNLKKEHLAQIEESEQLKVQIKEENTKISEIRFEYDLLFPRARENEGLIDRLNEDRRQADLQIQSLAEQIESTEEAAQQVKIRFAMEKSRLFSELEDLKDKLISLKMPPKKLVYDNLKNECSLLEEEKAEKLSVINKLKTLTPYYSKQEEILLELTRKVNELKAEMERERAEFKLKLLQMN